jgi:hypothetical protein
VLLYTEPATYTLLPETAIPEVRDSAVPLGIGKVSGVPFTQYPAGEVADMICDSPATYTVVG